MKENHASGVKTCEQHDNEARCSLAAGSVPWAWTHEPDSEYWNPAGKSREEAIQAGKRRGYRKFWIAQCRKMTAAERDEYDGTWIVDPTTHETITPNTPVTDAEPSTPANTRAQGPRSV